MSGRQTYHLGVAQSMETICSTDEEHGAGASQVEGTASPQPLSSERTSIWCSLALLEPPECRKITRVGYLIATPGDAVTKNWG